MGNFQNMNRPELIAYLETLGHKRSFLQYQGVSKLRQMAESGARYEPSAPAPVPAPVTPTASNTGNALAGIISALTDDVTSAVTARIMPEVERIAAGQTPRVIELGITLSDDEIKRIPMGTAHTLQPELFAWAVAGVNVYLVGPAGSGKTTAARKLAEALAELWGRPCPFYAFSADETMQTHNLLGYTLPSGITVRTPFREAYEHGGVLLIDELDTSPGLLTVLNMALDNGICAFPDGIISAHADFRCVAGGNTIGKGATSEYVARNRQDAALMNRFAFIMWDYDESLELAAAGADQKAWVTRVQALRKAHRALGASAPDILISPRASILGARRLRAIPATPFNVLEDSLIWQGASDDDKAKVLAKVK